MEIGNVFAQSTGTFYPNVAEAIYGHITTDEFEQFVDTIASNNSAKFNIYLIDKFDDEFNLIKNLMSDVAKHTSIKMTEIVKTTSHLHPDINKGVIGNVVLDAMMSRNMSSPSQYSIVSNNKLSVDAIFQGLSKFIDYLNDGTIVQFKDVSFIDVILSSENPEMVHPLLMASMLGYMLSVVDKACKEYTIEIDTDWFINCNSRSLPFVTAIIEYSFNGSFNHTALMWAAIKSINVNPDSNNYQHIIDLIWLSSYAIFKVLGAVGPCDNIMYCDDIDMLDLLFDEGKLNFNYCENLIDDTSIKNIEWVSSIMLSRYFRSLAINVDHVMLESTTIFKRMSVAIYPLEIGAINYDAQKSKNVPNDVYADLLNAVSETWYRILEVLYSPTITTENIPFLIKLSNVTTSMGFDSPVWRIYRGECNAFSVTNIKELVKQTLLTKDVRISIIMMIMQTRLIPKNICTFGDIHTMLSTILLGQNDEIINKLLFILFYSVPNSKYGLITRDLSRDRVIFLDRMSTIPINVAINWISYVYYKMTNGVIDILLTIQMLSHKDLLDFNTTMISIDIAKDRCNYKEEK